MVGKEIGGYLTKLEKEYEIISKKQPLFEKSSAKNVRYIIEDNFFTFWFRFIYKYSYMLEIENYGSVKMIIGRDYETFSGLMLERYFKRVLIEQQAYTRIGGWWDRKGENEIDIVAENELDDRATFSKSNARPKISTWKNWKRKQPLSCVQRESSKVIPCHTKDCQ